MLDHHSGSAALRRTKIIGTLGQYPTRTDALRMLDRFRLRLNLQHRFGMPVTLDALVDHYVDKELSQLRYGTQVIKIKAGAGECVGREC